MPQIFFYLFTILAVLSACLMVIVKNPVSSALWMVAVSYTHLTLPTKA